MNCQKCQKEVTKEEIGRGNAHEFMGEVSHRVCPGEICCYCHKPIESGTESLHRTALRQAHHRTCKPRPISEQGRRERREADREYFAHERGQWKRS